MHSRLLNPSLVVLAGAALAATAAHAQTTTATGNRAQLGINTTGFSYTIPSLIRVATNQPRTIGVDLKYRF
jgi:hypothetical protein